MSNPLVSCICPTRNRPRFLQNAVRYFLAQDWPNRELLILDDSEDLEVSRRAVRAMSEDPRIRCMGLSTRASIGEKRNILVGEAAGEIICHWDDDDWYGPRRISEQMRPVRLCRSVTVFGYSKVLFADDKLRRCWLYDGLPELCIVGTSLMYRRDYALQKPFWHVDESEDNHFVTNTPPELQYVSGEVSADIVARIHDGNTCQRPLELFDNSPWVERPWADMEVMGYRCA